MTAITSLDLSNAKLDVDHIAAIATSLQPTATDRLGHTKLTMNGAVSTIMAFTDRGSWAASTSYAVKDLVSVSGTWYVAVVAHVSSSTFAADQNTKWRVYQGVIAGDLAASNGSSLIGYNSSVGRTVEQQIDMISLQRFDVTDPKFAGGVSPLNTPLQNAAAFQAVSAAVNAADGGIIYIPASTSPYITGGQVMAGATGMGYAYQMIPNIDIQNCTGAVVIEGYGATLKLAPGLKFGSFNPVTGLPAAASSNPDNGADAGTLINVQFNNKVTIKGLELDGNSASLVLGGSWGGVGYQRFAYGIRAVNNESFSATDIYSHHNGTDGVIIGYAGAVESSMQNNYLQNVVCEYNSRQGLSWVGGNGLTAVNCKFNYTGRGAFSSSPGAGLDIEAEGAVIRNGVFINCEMGGNFGAGMVADSGDSADVTFISCKFYGTVNYSIWPKKPRFKFISCVIAGGMVNTYNSPNEVDRTYFTGCVLTGDRLFNGVAAKHGTYLADVGSQNPIFDDMVFVSNTAAMRLPNSTVGATYRNCKLTQNGSTATVTPRGTYEGVNSITMSTGSADIGGLINYGKITTTGSIVGAAVSQTGEIPSTVSAATSVVVGVGSNGSVFLASNLVWRYLAPTTGTWTRGDRCFNNNPTVGAPKGWICTASGTPGTWVSEGNL